MTDSPGCCLRIKENMHKLPPKEKIIAEYILQNPEAIVNMSIDSLANACGTSLSAITRLAKSLNFSGFKEMVRALSSELVLNNQKKESEYKEIHLGDPVREIFRDMCLREIEAIQNTMSIMDIDQLEKAVDLLCKAKRIDFYGVGSSGLVAEDASSKFLRINKIAIGSSDVHLQRLRIMSLTPEDVAVLISYSGETNDILILAKLLNERNIPIITITRSSKNTLASLGEINLFGSSTESLIRSGAMTSRISQLVIIDSLYTAVCSRLFDEVKPYLDETQKVSSELSRMQK